MMWGYYDGWSWLWMTSMMLLFWGGLIAVAMWGIRAISSPKASGDPAIEVLRRRLAAGEIKVEDFEKTNKALKG